MRILIAGGSGMIGQFLQEELSERGHEVYILSRRSSNRKEMVRWSPSEGRIFDDRPYDAVINLSGAGIIDKAWTEDYKKTIVESRVQSTEVLDKHFRQSEWSPSVYINASAIGIYGHHPDKLFSEEDEALSSDFLVIACEAWEGAVHEMKTPISNKYIIRIGVVLSERGGAFPKISMGRPIGVVSHLGDGQQYMSWIHIEDLVGIFVHLLEKKPVSGTYNAVAPEPVSNKKMSETIAATGLLGISPPVPEFMIGLMLGKRKITVLNSTRVSSEKIETAGYAFKFGQLPQAIGDLVKRSTRSGRRLLSS